CASAWGRVQCWCWSDFRGGHNPPPGPGPGPSVGLDHNLRTAALTQARRLPEGRDMATVGSRMWRKVRAVGVGLAVAFWCLLFAEPAFADSATPAPQLGPAIHGGHAVPFDPFLDDLEQRTFRYFWDTANPKNGLVPDRYPNPPFASIAAVACGRTAYPIGVERGYRARAAARERVLTTLRFFVSAPNEHGFFYHFMDMRSGARASDSEVSTVDTALLLAGMIFCQSYFDTQDPHDVEIRRLTDE